MASRADIIASLATDLASPRILTEIDKVIVALFDLRRLAVTLHGDPGPAPVYEASQPTSNEGRSDAPTEQPSDTIGTISGLIERYKSDDRSAYIGLRFQTRKYYDSLMKRLLNDFEPETSLADIKQADIQRAYDKWIEGGKLAMAHSLITMLRQMVNFGAQHVEDRDCQRLSVVLKNMRFKIEKPRTETMTPEMATKIREVAHQKGFHSIALAQAFQFDCQLHQKDVIGEWVPIAEPGTSEIKDGGQKWLRGIRWSEIDDNLILRHTTSKRRTEIEIDLRKCRMVREELERLKERPRSGPVIICERTDIPWRSHYFRQRWREIAEEAGVPENVRNTDSRFSENGRSLENRFAPQASGRVPK
jgi:hypothetical protein